MSNEDLGPYVLWTTVGALREAKKESIRHPASDKDLEYAQTIIEALEDMQDDLCLFFTDVSETKGYTFVDDYVTVPTFPEIYRYRSVASARTELLHYEQIGAIYDGQFVPIPII